jgi:hypothetical protein
MFSGNSATVSKDAGIARERTGGDNPAEDQTGQYRSGSAKPIPKTLELAQGWLEGQEFQGSQAKQHRHDAGEDLPVPAQAALGHLPDKPGDPANDHQGENRSQGEQQRLLYSRLPIVVRLGAGIADQYPQGRECATGAGGGAHHAKDQSEHKPQGLRGDLL